MKIRDIKFRAYDKLKKEWVDDIVLSLNGCPHTRAETGAHEVVEKWYKDTYPAESCASYSCPWVFDASNWYGAENIILQQYTGLTDRNGKEIYEGDIVRLFSPDGEPVFHAEINFDYGCWMITHIQLYSHVRNCEVIGNIFESPELC